MTTKPNIKTQSELRTGTPADPNLPFVLRRDRDTIPNFKISLRDIDTAVKMYMTEAIRPVINVNGQSIKVPVEYMNSEKWKNVQYDGFYRDSENKIQLPLIGFRRSSTTKNRIVSSKIDPDNPQIQIMRGNFFSEQNALSTVSLYTDRKSITDTYYVITPDYVDVTYNFIIWTDRTNHMAQLQEMFLYAEGGYWGNKESFQFRMKIDDMSEEVSIEDGNDRGVRCTFEGILSGYIIPNTVQAELAAINLKHQSPARIVLNTQLK